MKKTFKNKIKQLASSYSLFGYTIGQLNNKTIAYRFIAQRFEFLILNYTIFSKNNNDFTLYNNVIKKLPKSIKKQSHLITSRILKAIFQPKIRR